MGLQPHEAAHPLFEKRSPRGSRAQSSRRRTLPEGGNENSPGWNPGNPVNFSGKTSYAAKPRDPHSDPLFYSLFPVP